VIAPAAVAIGDIRTLSNEQTDRVEQKMRAIVAQHLPKTDATLAFTESYPAMAETPESRQLARQWSDISVALGLGPVAEAGVMTRGAGDIAFVAPYVPGLVGVGLIGAGMHAEGETGQLDSLPRQAKRNAVLMERLIHTPAGH
jgi:glutamate carboxypeptidase